MTELVAVPDEQMPNLYVVKWEGHGGGKVPQQLEGFFSTRLKAKLKIEAYHNRPKPKPIEYKGTKKITDEEEAEMFKEVQEKVEAINNGKKQKEKSKNKS